MPSFRSRLFGKAKAVVSPDSAALDRPASSSPEGPGRREPPTEIDWAQAEYVPLPPSPATWEVDGRDELHREYDDPALGSIFRAGLKGQHAKTTKLAAGLSAEQRQGRVGEVIAKAYRKLIIQRMKAGQLAAAAAQCLRMFELVPSYVQDVDRRRFNRLLDQMDKAGKKHRFERVVATSPSEQPLFIVSHDSGWVLDGQRKLAADERPDPAFNIAAVNGSGTWLLDRKRARAGQSDVKATLRRLDQHGHLVADKQLGHDAYRVGRGAAGSSIAIMDSTGVLHIYDAELNLLVETDLREDPRVVDHFRTIETNYWGEFKSQVRAVDVAPEGDRYLFTLADEAWCCTVEGRAIWGVVMPLQEGWKRVVGRSERFGVAREVDEALHLFGLSLPVTLADIKRQWRALGPTVHPDTNPDNPHATEEFKALGNAYGVLTGADANELSFEEIDTTSFVRSEPDQLMEVFGMQVEITTSMGIPQDWVYAASFAAANGGAYVATYSGTVNLLSREGRTLVVYDIGTCPKEIVNMGRYTYFLTPTRLYVVEDGNKLAAFLDVFEQGQLIVSPSGFGLLTSKSLQWFTAAGTTVGELRTRDPIRAINAVDGGAIVQTRRHQVTVRGLAV